ncbi:hypothetical protein, partial [Pectinatus cerevisiiphilus]|uniref:hypothetical protein n=1 Tax=Pectinatus cerevisiiphilus TaxID=86956 RepID=UPI001A9F2BE5
IFSSFSTCSENSKGIISCLGYILQPLFYFALTLYYLEFFITLTINDRPFCITKKPVGIPTGLS